MCKSCRTIWILAVVAILFMAVWVSSQSQEADTVQKTDSETTTNADVKTDSVATTNTTTGAVEVKEPVWMTDFEKATKLATKQKRPILVNFSGSDWCTWCQRLDKEVLAKKAFKDYAGKNLVLFVADFPARKKQPESVKQQNQMLAEKYGVRGFPTVLLLNSKGRALAQTGYRAGGADKYVVHLEELVSKAAAKSNDQKNPVKPLEEKESTPEEGKE